MAYTTGQTAAQITTELQSVNANLTQDAINTILSTLAAGSPTPVGTPILVSGVLLKCSQGYGVSPGTTPVYAYDAGPS